MTMYEEYIVTNPKQWTDVTAGPQVTLHFQN